MLPSVGGSAEKAPSVLLRHASLPSKKRSWPDEPPRDKARPWVEAEKGKRGQGRVGPLRRMGRAWRSLTFDARKMLLFIVLDLAYLLVEMGYGLAVNNMGAPFAALLHWDNSQLMAIALCDLLARTRTLFRHCTTLLKSSSSPC
jgi:hypothetical protein